MSLSFKKSFQTLFICSSLGALSVSVSAAAEPIAECHPLQTSSCFFPFPNQGWIFEENGQKRISVPMDKVFDPQTLSTLDAQLPDNLKIEDMEDIFAASGGFSPATPVLFEFEQAIDADALPRSGANAIIAINVNTGERQLVDAKVSQYALSDAFAAAGHMVEIYHNARWEFSNHYVVAVTADLLPEGMERFENHDELNSKALAHAKDIGVWELLKAQGIDDDSLLSLTDFTIRSEEEVTSSMKAKMKSVYAAPHPLRNMEVQYKSIFFSPNIAAVVTGEVLTYSYRNQDGSIDHSRTDGEPLWVDFRLTLPRDKGHFWGKKSPIVVYGHGLMSNKESMITVSITNAMHNIATVVIDQPNHGSRVGEDRPSVEDSLQTKNMLQLIGMTFQSPVDTMSLLSAVKSSIGQIDVLPRKSWRKTKTFNLDYSANGAADLDVNNVSYQGTSLGGVLGITFVALAPKLKGTFLHVTGVGVIRALSDSALWDSTFSALMPTGVTAADAVGLRSVVTHLLDHGDAINFAHYLHTPPEGINKKPVAVVVGAGDAIVPNTTTIGLANIAKLPVVGVMEFDMPGVEHRWTWDNGSGIKHVEWTPWDHSDLLNQVEHFSFLTPEAQAIQAIWIERFIK